MKAEKTIIKEGVVIELEGSYFGVSYEDGQVTSYDFISIEKAIVYDAKYYECPVDVLSEFDRKRRSDTANKLIQSKFKKVKITTTYEVL